MTSIKPLWHKYFWKMKNENIIGLYSVETNEECYYAEISLDYNEVKDCTLMNKILFDIKWKEYFYNEKMLGLSELIKLDKIVWKNVFKNI